MPTALNDLEILTRFVEVCEPLDEFSCCTLDPAGKDPAKLALYHNGEVVCPPHRGNWTGMLTFFQGNGYSLVFKKKNVPPTKTKVYMDLEKAQARVVRLREKASQLNAEAEGLEDFLKRTGRTW